MATNKTTLKISDTTHNFFYDIQSNVGIKLKETHKKRFKPSQTECMDIIVKQYKMNNLIYQELIDIIIQNGNK